MSICWGPKVHLQHSSQDPFLCARFLHILCSFVLVGRAAPPSSCVGRKTAKQGMQWRRCAWQPKRGVTEKEGDRELAGSRRVDGRHQRRRLEPSAISTVSTGASGLRVRIFSRSSSLGSPGDGARGSEKAGGMV